MPEGGRLKANEANSQKCFFKVFSLIFELEPLNSFYTLEKTMKVKITDIVIGKRIRKETGDLAPLIESMDRHGLLNPVTITGNNKLIAGFRRIQAASALGWNEIECHVIETASKLDRLMVEAEENMTRREFSKEEVEHFEAVRRYLAARGFEKFKLWIKYIIKKIRKWLGKYFGSAQ